MKLAAAFVVALLAGTASAQPYPAQPYPAQPYPAQPYPAQPYPAQPYPAQPYAEPPPDNGPPPGAMVGVGVRPVPPRAAFREMLLERFDRNHDGVLDRRERRQAAKVLRRIARRMARQGRRERPQGRQPFE